MKPPTLSQLRAGIAPATIRETNDPLNHIDPEALTKAIDEAKQGPLFTDLPQIVSRESLLESYEVAVRLLRSVEKHLDREQYVELASVRHTLALAKPGRFNR